MSFASSRNFTESSEYRRSLGDSYDTGDTSSRPNVPIQHLSSGTTQMRGSSGEQRTLDRIRTNDTAVQWVNDPITGAEKFRVTVNIDGFRQEEVNIHIDGNKLVLSGEHVENKEQGVSKKRIEKSYELPRDVDSFSPHVTFPLPTTMQIDFPSRHVGTIIKGKTVAVADHASGYRASPKSTYEKSSTEYTSTRKIGGGVPSSVVRERSSSPRVSHIYHEPLGSNTTGVNTYSTTSNSQYRPSSGIGGLDTSPRGVIVNSTQPTSSTYMSNIAPRITTHVNTSRSRSPAYTFHVTAGDPGASTNRTVHEQSFSETRRESHRRTMSPTTGEQSSHEFEHRTSGSPITTPSLHIDEDRFRTGVTLESTAPSASRNVEVREYSRRIGGTEPGLLTSSSAISDGGSSAFNSDAFYRSSFSPKIFTDTHGQRQLEMKLDVHQYEPSEIKVVMNGNDLIVQAEHSTKRPPTSSSRAYFYKQVSLPPNTDLSSLSSQYNPDGQLYITARILNEGSNSPMHIS